MQNKLSSLLALRSNHQPSQGDIPSLGATLEFQVAVVIKALDTDHAYASAIQQHLMERLRPDISFGAVQTTIARLEKKGIVYSPKMSAPINERGGRRRRLLCLTDRGEQALNLAKEKMDLQEVSLTRILEEALN